MGDRNNPIKFGPEWLRNLSLEHNAGTSNNNNPNQTRSTFPNTTTSSGAIPGTSTGNTASGPSTSNVPYSAQSTLAKVLLAKQRFGKEEMLALYDKDVEAPEELKQIEVLYQARGKPPIALNNTFDDDMRDNMRSGPSTSSGVSPGERFNLNRGGLGRLNVTEGRGRARLPFVRQMPSVRGGATWHPRMPLYSGGPDEEPSMNVRSSWNNSNGGNAANATQNDHWTNKMFRSKRQGTPANWRQSREEGEEWRAQESRTRNNQQDQKRDWSDRPQEKQSWSSNRRTWVGGDTQNNDDNLPEWAMDNAEACGGTFDSSGAFHGYSNDDTNLPKSHEAPYPLTRSNTTHGSTGASFSASKSVDESSDEWWASEKAKKLSPKRFDASDIKFKKQMSLHEGNTDSNTDIKPFTSKGETHHETTEKNDSSFSLESPDPSTSACDDEKPKINTYQSTFSRVDSGEMLSDMNFGETGDEKGNFQSVIINTPNNILRQKHQNIVPAAPEASKGIESNINRDSKPGILHLLQNAQTSHALENELRKAQTPENKLVDDFIDLTIDDKESPMKQKAIASPQNQSSANITSTLPLMVNSLSQIPTPSMQLGLSSPVFPNQGLANPKQNMPTPGMPVGMQGLPAGMHLAMQMPAGLQISALPQSLQVAGMQHLSLQQSGMQPPGVQQSGMQQSSMQQPSMQQSNVQQTSGIQQSTLQMSGNQQSGLQSGSGMHQPTMPISIPTPGMQGGLQTSGMQSGLQGNMQSSMQPVGITNSALNASLGLTILNNQMGLPLQNVGTPVLGMSGINSGIGGPNMQGGMSAGMQASNTGLPSFPNSIPGMSNANATNNSLFMGQNPNNSSMGNTSNNNIGLPNLTGQSNMFPMHGLQHSSSQGSFGSSIYSNIMQQAPNQPQPSQNVNDQWYYEDPAKNIQGPFLAKDMYNWYRAGFFSPNLMVRRACDAHMRPLGSYGPIVPFVQRDVLPGFSMSNNYDRSPHESLMNQQHALGLESVMNIPNLNEGPPRDPIQFGSVGLIRNPSFPQQQPMVDSLWSQSSPEHWVQQALNNALSEPRANYYIWDQPSNISSNQMLPEDITKDMKTEDQILAQLRAAQNISSPQNVPFLSEQPVASPTNKKIEEPFASTPITVAKLEELQKLIQKDNLSKSFNESLSENVDTQEYSHLPPVKAKTVVATENNRFFRVLTEPPKSEKHTIVEQPFESKIIQTKPVTEVKQPKPSKTDNEKASKNKENNNTKNKNKKKEEKKDDIESKIKEDDNTVTEKRSEELSPTKGKKEDKVNKKELEKEKKEWLKDGFTIVKGSEKNASKDNKKKIEEAKLAEEAERKRKEEEERLAAEEERKRKQAEMLRKQELQQQKQQQRQAAESVVKKAPWSAVANQGMMSTSKDGLTLGEIQRLEREKKLEQMKEQQQMMQIIAQQQAAALAREQEMQAGLGWAKKKASMNVPSQSLAEIQAEARKQAAASAAAAAAAAAEAAISQALDEGRPPPMIPWASAPNGGGFWDTQPNQPPKVEKSLESPKPVEIKNKKKAPVNVLPKKETSPAAEFDAWCNNVLASWSSKIDVPTFVGFLKDIESPYEVKDYVKCYLGESKDTSDFARHFLERRSKLLRASTVTPSDDLCSPAMAINPRNTSNSDYQEVKGKGKKTKKNKMLKVDARILGFSVTASEDRINVGDIDTV